MPNTAPKPKRKNPYTEARKNANRLWDEKALDRMSVAFPKGSRDIIKDHARRQGESANKFIFRAINETMQRDQEKNPIGQEAAEE